MPATHKMLCSPLLKKKERGRQECRFGYPKSLQEVTTVITQESGEPLVQTAPNDTLLNAFNPVQLSAWRANVDMQYIVSREKVVKYVAKYATKSECRSKALQEMKNVKEDGTPLKVVQAQRLFCSRSVPSYLSTAHVQGFSRLCNSQC